MGIAFSGFRGKLNQNGLIWQEHDSLFPYQCSQCKRIFEKGGKRWLGSSMAKQSHNVAVCQCDDCHNGIDPNRRKAPVLAERRTELD